MKRLLYIGLCVLMFLGCTKKFSGYSKNKDAKQIDLLPEYSQWSGILMGFSNCDSEVMSPLLVEQTRLLKEVSSVTKVKAFVDESCEKNLSRLQISGLEFVKVGSGVVNLKWMRDHALIWSKLEKRISVAELRHGRSSAGGIEGLTKELNIHYEDRTKDDHTIHGGNFQISSNNRCFLAYTVGYLDEFEKVNRQI